jgi:hypothetical protein
VALTNAERQARYRARAKEARAAAREGDGMAGSFAGLIESLARLYDARALVAAKRFSRTVDKADYARHSAYSDAAREARKLAAGLRSE